MAILPTRKGERVGTAAAQDSRFPSGRIALQYGQGTVKFRRVQIKLL
jgi:hypothetical protein